MLGRPSNDRRKRCLFQRYIINPERRGYRAVQLEGGICAGKIYLTSYSQGLGASGSTFYDDEVTETFLPHADQKSSIIAIGIGIPAYLAKSGKIYTNVLNKEDYS